MYKYICVTNSRIKLMSSRIKVKNKVHNCKVMSSLHAGVPLWDLAQLMYSSRDN